MAQFCMISTKPGDAEVFLYTPENRWESIWGTKKTSRVQFCSFHGHILFKVIAEDSLNEREYPISLGLRVIENGPQAVQVTLFGAGTSVIFLIKFKSAEAVEEFLMKVKNERGLQELQNSLYVNPDHSFSGLDAARNERRYSSDQSPHSPQDLQSGTAQRLNYQPMQDERQPMEMYFRPSPVGRWPGNVVSPVMDDLTRAMPSGREAFSPSSLDAPPSSMLSRGAPVNVLPRGVDDPLPKAGYNDFHRASYESAAYDGFQRVGYDDGLLRAGSNGPQRAGYDDGHLRAGSNGPQKAGYDDVPLRAGSNGPQRAGYDDGPLRAGSNGPQKAGYDDGLQRDGSRRRDYGASDFMNQPQSESGSRGSLEKLCSQLTESLNSRNIERAKQLLQVLSAFDKGSGKFQAVCELPKQVKPSYMNLTVSIEFQKTKEPLKVYFDIDENASFSDLQVLLEEQLRIPCATQNWIVGDKLVSTGNLTKKLSDYGIKKDSNDPPLYLYVVHPKKVNMSREELVRVGALQPMVLHSDLMYAIPSQGPDNQGYGQDVLQRKALPSNTFGMGFAQGAGGPYRSVPTIDPPVFPQRGTSRETFLPPGKLQAPPPPPPKPVGWECPTCTFLNKPQRPGCEQCSTARPDDYKVPNDATLLDDPAKREEELLIEFLEQEKRKQLQQRDQNYAELVEADNIPLNTNAKDFDCMICYTPVPAGEGVILRGCLHEFCKDCLKQHINTTTDAEVKCPYNDGNFACDCPIYEREIRALLTQQELDNLHDRGLRIAENAGGDHAFHCRTPNCKGFCFYGDDVNEFICQVCNKKNCILCKATHKGMNCQEYQDDLKRRAANDEAAKATQDMLDGMIKNGEAMNCPTCKVVVTKKDGCDWIRCSMCKTEICWATKGPRWGPKGNGDNTAGCKCRVGGKKCHPMCRNCH